MGYTKLTDENFLLYAMHNYNNYECNRIDDFEDDVNRIKYVKRLLRKYVNSDELRERLILNHLVLLGNVFGAAATTRILFFKLEKKLWPSLKTFLIYLDYMQDDLYDPSIVPTEIPLDDYLIEILRDLK